MIEIPTSQPRLRQSCDRCHAQKLRCVRDSTSPNASTGAAGQKGSCQRCNRLRSKCVYSMSAPKGRPSIYSVAPRVDNPQGPSKDGESTRNGGTLDSHSEAVSSAMRENGATAVAGMNELGATNPFDIFGVKETHVDCDADQWLQQFVDAGSTDSTIIDTSMLDWAFDGSNDTFNEQIQGCESRSLDNESSSGAVSTSSVEPTNLKGADYEPALPASLEKLSRLNMRLCTLNSLTSAFALDGCGHHDGPIVDEAAVITMTSWMSHASSGTSNDKASAAATIDQSSNSVGTVMCDIFSASRELCEVLGILATFYASTTESNSPAAEAQVSTMTIVLPSCDSSECSGRSSSVMTRDGSSTRQGADAVDQMVIACSILLTNIFTVVITAIHRDAELWAPTTPMADIRPILVAQVCSYVIDRQNRALDTYNEGRTQPRSFDGESAVKLSEMNARREELARLREGVQARFDHLRKFLRM